MNKYPGVVQCLSCKKILVSFHRHDFRSCSCKQATFVDGGHDYLRYGGKSIKKIQILKIIKMPSRKE